MLAVGLSYMAFIMFKYVASVTTLESFYFKWLLNFVKNLFTHWYDHMIFSLQSVNVKYHTDWFVDVQVYLHQWDKSHLIIMFYSFKVLTQFANV